MAVSAVCLKSVCRAKDHELIKAWIQERFHTSRPKSLPTKRPLQLKCTKPSLITNICLEPRKNIYNYSTANFHHLATNILICDVAYFPMFNRFKAKDDEKVSMWEKHLDDVMRGGVANHKLEAELSRLRRKGAMKDIPVKTPEGIDGIAAPPKF